MLILAARFISGVGIIRYTVCTPVCVRVCTVYSYILHMQLYVDAIDTKVLTIDL